MINKVILVGNVGKDPEVRHLENGTAVASFSLATSETYKDRDGNRQTRTEWHNIVLWRGLADVVEKYVKKGQMLYIEGRLTSRSYDGQDGNKKYITEIVANEMKMFPKGNSGSGSADNYEQKHAPVESTVSEPDLETDDLPF